MHVICLSPVDVVGDVNETATFALAVAVPRQTSTFFVCHVRLETQPIRLELFCSHVRELVVGEFQRIFIVRT